MARGGWEGGAAGALLRCGLHETSERLSGVLPKETLADGSCWVICVVRRGWGGVGRDEPGRADRRGAPAASGARADGGLHDGARLAGGRRVGVHCQDGDRTDRAGEAADPDAGSQSAHHVGGSRGIFWHGEHHQTSMRRARIPRAVARQRPELHSVLPHTGFQLCI